MKFIITKEVKEMLVEEGKVDILSELYNKKMGGYHWLIIRKVKEEEK